MYLKFLRCSLFDIDCPTLSSSFAVRISQVLLSLQARFMTLPPGATHRWRRNAGDTLTRLHHSACHTWLDVALVLLSARRRVTAGSTDPLPRRNLLKMRRYENVITVFEFHVEGRYHRLEAHEVKNDSYKKVQIRIGHVPAQRVVVDHRHVKSPGNAQLAFIPTVWVQR